MVTGALLKNVEGTIGLLDGLMRAGRPSTLVGPVTTMRRFSAVTVPLADVATVRGKFDVTLNDVALAAITDSYRGAILRRGSSLGGTHCGPLFLFRSDGTTIRPRRVIGYR